MTAEPFRPPTPTAGPIVVEVHPDLWPLVPGFLANRVGDVERLRGAIASGDAAILRDLGHKMRGMGGGYGFDYISTVGRALEEMAVRGDLADGSRWIDALADYLARVEPKEGPEDE